MPKLDVKIKDIQEKIEYLYGFNKGVNKLQDESLIEDQELSDHRNGIIVVDGVKKRAGTARFGSSSGSRVYGGSPFYTSDGERFMIRAGGTALQYYNGSNVPTNISGATMTASVRTSFAMARDTLYVENGTDPLVKIESVGGVPTATTFTALTTPTNVAITATGTTGSTNYSYRISAFNATGETLASVSVGITNGNATLSTTNYNAVTWDAVTDATGYNIYGRQARADNGIGETKLATVTTTSYDDKGTDTPSTTLTPPEGNSTAGQKGTIIRYAMSRLFVAGDSANPSRLYYSGSGTQLGDFSTAYAGGWVDVSKNDGSVITAIEYFQNKVIVFKNRSVWQFSFTSSGLPQLELITAEIGCCAHRGVQIVNNDLWFPAVKDGRLAVYSLGNVQNYFNALRTTEQSLKISQGSYLDSANLSQASNIASYYFRNLYILAVAQGSSTVNDRCYVYDTRFGAWVGYWDGFTPNCFFTYQDGDGNEELYFGDDSSGYVVQMFEGSNDDGTAVSWQLSTKNFMQKYFDQYKIYRNPVLWFKDVSNGAVTGYLINDGVFSSGSFSVAPLVSGIGAGFDIPGLVIAGDSEGSSTTTLRSDQPMEIIYSKIARSLKLQLTDSNPSSDFKFLGWSYRWLLLQGKPLPAENRIRLTS